MNNILEINNGSHKWFKGTLQNIAKQFNWNIPKNKELSLINPNNPNHYFLSFSQNQVKDLKIN
jgi:hypothetical protein